ncbi:MAG: c-type cytochrome [Gemmatimonadales bacterium]|nr:c-type cytochrome [Gemmatimonadales bacterium]NIN12085.1 c-type cytochrome [Gemmatimonadales bacterium]NIR03320.1 c-type cytochrome [Gemmatimonadales bacterium]NIS67000.1 c-type cytochrome [Gemmatimonadales bacterium]
MNPERTARVLVFALALALPLGVLLTRWAGIPRQGGEWIEIHGRMSDDGGWTPDEITVDVGEVLHLRLTSDDVVHGFAIGQSNFEAVDVMPGEVTQATVTLEQPGRYVFYCTRWCGVNHWRMRGTIDVRGETSEPDTAMSPLYQSLGIDLEAPHPADVAPPDDPPSSHRGANLGVPIPDRFLTAAYYRAHSPGETWHSLRAEAAAHQLTDEEVWDLVALVWASNATPSAIEEGGRLYASNCAACHGERGAGDGVMARALANGAAARLEDRDPSPANFTDAVQMLGATPALLQGKIIRGGMGTGMPNWGPILTDAETWALVAYLWRFQFGPANTGPDTAR